MEHKYQHIIPEVHLRRWEAPNLGPGRNGQIWVIQKDELTNKIRSPPKASSANLTTTQCGKVPTAICVSKKLWA